jgi:pimeloyl-ACP methyl ester carboxylesterase
MHYLSGMHGLKLLLVWMAIVLTALLLLGYCFEQIAEWRSAKRGSVPGRLVNVGSHRLHLFCQGSGDPTVVIEQGAGEPSRLWWPIQQQIADFAHVCTYDRAGYSHSEAGPRSRSISDRAEELNALLTRAQIPAPYILVAHSYGGLIVQQFARRYPASTAGLVLVDTTDEQLLSDPEVQRLYSRIRLFLKALEVSAHFGVPRLLRHFPALREGLSFVEPKEYASAADDLGSLKNLDQTPHTPGELGSIPVVVITHGQPFPGPFAILEKDWMPSQQRLLMLSCRSTLITAKNSDHTIQLQQPDVIVEAIKRMQKDLFHSGC